MRDPYMIPPGRLKAVRRGEFTVSLAQFESCKERAKREIGCLVNNIVQPVDPPYGEDVEKEARSKKPRRTGRLMLVIKSFSALKHINGPRRSRGAAKQVNADRYITGALFRPQRVGRFEPGSHPGRIDRKSESGKSRYKYRNKRHPDFNRASAHAQDDLDRNPPQVAQG